MNSVFKLFGIFARFTIQTIQTLNLIFVSAPAIQVHIFVTVEALLFTMIAGVTIISILHVGRICCVDVLDLSYMNTLNTMAPSTYSYSCNCTLRIIILCL